MTEVASPLTTETRNRTHDHLVARSQGGSDEETNLITLCVECHGLLRGVEWRNNHALLTRDGLAAAKARGVKLGGERSTRLDDDARASGPRCGLGAPACRVRARRPAAWQRSDTAVQCRGGWGFRGAAIER
jgi:hypothetical protein